MCENSMLLDCPDKYSVFIGEHYSAALTDCLTITFDKGILKTSMVKHKKSDNVHTVTTVSGSKYVFSLYKVKE